MNSIPLKLNTLLYITWSYRYFFLKTKQHNLKHPLSQVGNVIPLKLNTIYQNIFDISMNCIPLKLNKLLYITWSYSYCSL